MIRIIQKSDDGIHRWDLIDEAHISIRDYNMVKSYFQHKFDGLVYYNKGTQMWSALKIPVKQKLEIQETINEDSK